MFIELTQNEKATIHNKFKNSGFEITEIDLTTAEFSVSDNNKSTSCIVELPDKTKGYNDYSAIMLWTNDESGYSSFPVPLSYNSVMGEGETAKLIDIRITLQDVEPGKIKIIFSVYDDNYDYTFFDDMIFSLESLALFSAPYLNVSAENTIIAGTNSTLFDVYFASYKESLMVESIFKEKRNILTCDYDEETANDLIKYYTVSWREPTGTSTEPVFDGTNYYAPASKVNLTYVPFIKIDGLIGYTSDAYDSLDEQTKLNASTVNTQKLNEEISKLSVKARYVFLEKDLIYPVGNTAKNNGDNGIANVSKCIELGSNVTLVGNNATLCAVTGSNVVSVIFGSNKIVRNPNMTYGNTHFYNLNVIGRYTDTDKPADQAVHCANVNVNESYTALPKNVTFNNCKFTDFCFGIHINNNAYYDIPLYWTFDNCDFKTGMGFNLTGVKSLKLLNSHIDNCLSTDKFNHCIYISEKCSYLTVDNCLLENSAGGAIHQNYGHELKNSEFNHNNTFKNITIRSCQTGLNIGLTSKSINAENIYMYDVLRGIILNSCVDVEIKNIYATGSFYRRPRNYANGRERVFNSHIKLYESTENGLPVSDDAWTAIGIKGKVKAKISNGYFKFSSPTIGSSAYLTTDINGGNNGAREIDYVYEQHKDWFEDDFVEANVVFENCAFDSTYNNLYKSYKKENGIISSYCTSERSNSYVGVSVAQKITSNPNLEITYKNNIKFIRCKFEMNYDTVSKVFFYFKGNPKSVSTYSFESCNIFLYIEDYIAQQNKKLFGAYFSYAGKGANISLVNCNFRKNCLLYKALGNPKTECQYWANGDGETIISNCTEALFDYQLDDFPN